MLRGFFSCNFLKGRRLNIYCIQNAHTALHPKSEITDHYQEFPEQQIEIKTCGELYKKWKEKRKFWNLPETDLHFNVRYIDTMIGDPSEHALINADSPTVLALHGAPGSYTDFNRMTSFLSEKGIRVIAPCFPDFNAYQPGVFRHSASEKTQYIKDFLKAINVLSVDLLVCHSSAVYPGLKLSVENVNPMISGLALFNPGAFYTSMRAIQPWHFLRTMVKMSETSVGLKFIESFGTPILKLVSSRVAVDNPLDPLLSATVMAYGGITKSKKLYPLLLQRGLPVLFAFSEDDKLVDNHLSHQIAYALGLNDDNIYQYNEEGHLIKEGQMYRNVKAMCFKKGSHYVFSKHSEVINEEIFDFLQKIVL